MSDQAPEADLDDLFIRPSLVESLVVTFPTESVEDGAPEFVDDKLDVFEEILAAFANRPGHPLQANGRPVTPSDFRSLFHVATECGVRFKGYYLFRGGVKRFVLTAVPPP